MAMITICKACGTAYQLEDSLVKPNGVKVRCSKCQLIFTVFSQNAVNRRKHTRKQTRNLISHTTVDEDDKLVSQGLSKAVDVSKGGMLLETPHPIDSGVISLVAIDMNNQFFEIQGELVYCKRQESGLYHSGIKFIGTDKQKTNFIVSLIREYNHRKSNLSNSVTLNFAD